MKDLPGKKLNKKGFTLAELLIVVAIIAILVAIALPLFFGAMDNAREARDNANKRAAKAAATNAILSDPNKYRFTEAEPDVTADCWLVTAFISDDGTIEVADILPFTNGTGISNDEFISDMKGMETFENYTVAEKGEWSKYIGWSKYYFPVFNTELAISEAP